MNGCWLCLFLFKIHMYISTYIYGVENSFKECLCLVVIKLWQTTFLTLPPPSLPVLYSYVHIYVLLYSLHLYTHLPIYLLLEYIGMRRYLWLGGLKICRFIDYVKISELPWVYKYIVWEPRPLWPHGKPTYAWANNLCHNTKPISFAWNTCFSTHRASLL